MFTGLVDDLGLITHVADTPAGRELRIRCRYTDLVDGESIAANGACLTVREHGVHDDGSGWFTVAAVITTLGRTTIDAWPAGARVNLERAMRLGDRLGGHMVLGHVDAVGHVVSPAPDLVIRIPRDLMHLIVEKGSITVDGISLTVFDLSADTFRVAVIPHTTAVTTLGVRKVGDAVNIEMDVLAKHVQRLVEPHTKRKWWRK